MYISKRVLALLAVLVLLLLIFAVSPFQVARVQGDSMAPTLIDGDHVVVNKLVYRWRPPARGDIVVLYYPVNPDKTFVDRVVAEEGDRVQIIKGRYSQ